jgi:hypothetical protein
MRTYLATALTALVVSHGIAAAQDAPPEGWRWVTDGAATVVGRLDPKPGELTFVTMAPGWHLTTGPAASLFEPTVSMRGRFAIESEAFLFPGTSAEGFGVFVGGRDLDGVARYLAFLIRRDGSAAVERREGGTTTLLKPWTRHTAIVAHAGDDKSTARNLLRIEAESASLVFLVNGAKVLEVPRTGDVADGVLGLRIGAGLNLHVTNLDATRKLALPRGGNGR